MRRAMAMAAMAVLCAATPSAPAAADEVADFYQGKTITVMVAHETGTGFDIYARVLVRHIGRHIPGQPNLVVQNILGAGGMTGANWLYNIAAKDGTVIGTTVHTIMLDQLTGDGTASRFDTNRFQYIGNIEQSVATCGVSAASGVTRFEDILTREIVFGGAAVTGALSQGAFALRNLIGAKIKMVQGYKGSADIKLALVRGEIQGICGLPISTLKTSWRDVVESGQ